MVIHKKTALEANTRLLCISVNMQRTPDTTGAMLSDAPVEPRWQGSGGAGIVAVLPQEIVAKEEDDAAHSATVVVPQSRAEPMPPESVLPNPLTLVAGRYEILNLLGEGGMGSVYRARDSVLDEIVAFKVLRRELAASSELIERFKREVKLARRVTHPNVARMFDIGEHEGTTFLTMEFIDGEPLTSILEREGPLPIESVSRAAGEICAGLAAAHAAGVVHRDLKPDNVMLGRDGRIRITDFGIARDPVASTGTVGMVVGTPAYMAPEQVEAQADIDARADIYALGVMLFELLTGQLPFKGTSAFTLAAARLTSTPPDPGTLRTDLPAAIGRVILKCMARDRDDRYADAKQVAEALASSVPTLAQGAAPIAPLPPHQPTESEHKTVAVLPFRNLGPSEDDYVADGMTEDLIDTLSMTVGLRVRPRSAVIGFKGVERDPREIGHELGVQVVVEGSVRRTPQAVRLSARLLSVEDGFQLWAQRFDRPANDLLVMSDETADAIAKALTVNEAGRGRVAADATVIDLYLRARSELHQIWPKSALRAMELLTAAHERAPDDVAILGAYARACARVWFFGGERGVRAGEKARALAERAVSLAPDDPHTLLAVTGIRLLDNDWRGAARGARRLRERAPSAPETIEMVGRLRLETGQLERALKELEAALALEPMLINSRIDRIRIHALLGDFPRVLALLDAELQTDPGNQSNGVLRARLSLWNQDVEKTLHKLELPQDLVPNTPWAFAATMKEIHADKDPLPHLPALEEIPDKLGASRRARSLFLQLLTEFCSYFDLRERALVHLESAVDAGLFDLGWMLHCPLLTRLDDEPRYQAALATIRQRAEELVRELDG